MHEGHPPVLAVHLARAPITEAIFDIRVKARKELSPDSFRDLVATYAPEFPIVEERRGFQVVFEMGGEGPNQRKEDLGLQSIYL
ncbi:MAG: hypothetical protein ACT4O1_03195, partial [Gemmatimonadota bacterium]